MLGREYETGGWYARGFARVLTSALALASASVALLPCFSRPDPIGPVRPSGYHTPHCVYTVVSIKDFYAPRLKHMLDGRGTKPADTLVLLRKD